MRLRRTALALFAIAALTVASAAQADRLHTGGIPLSPPTARMGAGIAAGFGHPLVANNTQVATNVAAGIGNTANQNVVGFQGGGPMVGLDFSGRGPMVTTNVGVNTNVAAGLGNIAGQGVSTAQR